MKMMNNQVGKKKEIIRYIFFGGCTTLVNIIVYFICTRFQVGTAFSTITAWILSVLFAYLTNRHFVFKSNASGFKAIAKEGMYFFSSRLITGLMDLGIMIIFVDWLHLNDLLIKILSNVIVIILNYMISKLFIFKKPFKEDTKIQTESQYNIILERVPSAFRGLFCGYLVCTLLMLLILDKWIYYIPMNDIVKMPNILLMIGSLSLFVLFTAYIAFKNSKKELGKLRTKSSDRRFYLYIGLFFVVVFIVQCFIASCIQFKTGWDAGLILGNAKNIVFHNALGVDEHYFGKFPNNLVLAYTLVYLYKLGNLLYSANPDFFVLSATSLTVCISVFLAAISLYKITKDRTVTVICMMIGTLLIAFSPWIVIPYSDALGMIFPVLAFSFYIFIPNRYIRCFLVILTCLLGYLYKPTIIIVLIAFGIIKLAEGLKNCINKKASIKRASGFILVSLVALVMVVNFRGVVEGKNKTVLNKNSQVTMTHYLMMGQNEENNGVYLESDTQFSGSFPDVKSRQSANLRVAKERLKELGPIGYLKLLTKKNLSNYNDGTFSWGKEGSFYVEIPEAQNEISKVLRSFYYTNDLGTNYQVFAVIEQILWLLVLLSAVFCMLPWKGGGDADSIIALSLLGVSIFLLIFECRARYLYIFSPLFLILAGMGMFKAAKCFIFWLKKDKDIRNEKYK